MARDSAKVAMQRPRLRHLYVQQAGLCHYCQSRVHPLDHNDPQHPRAPTRDHRVPQSRGGDSSPGNVVMACQECNRLKGDMPEEVFVAIRAKLKGAPTRKWLFIEGFYRLKFDKERGHG